VASERSSTGISSGRVRRQHIDEMFSPETDEGRRADLFHAYGVTHVLTRGRAPTWSRYWTVGGNRRHGHVVLVLRSEPDPALLWMREIEVARAQLDRGDAAGAIGRLQPVVRDHPRAVDAWFTLANALMASGGIEAAAAAYAQAEALEPDDPVHALMLGNAYSRLGRLGEAALEFERCAAIAERQNDAIAGAAANFNLGNTLYRMDRDEAALAAYERALELDADHVKARTARGWLRQDLGLDPPAPESPAAEGPAVDEHEAEDPGMDDPRVDDPRVDDPSEDAPRADTPPTAPATRPVP
jgi:tetratricopeptide (TPR) repeat protein